MLYISNQQTHIKSKYFRGERSLAKASPRGYRPFSTMTKIASRVPPQKPLERVSQERAFQKWFFSNLYCQLSNCVLVTKSFDCWSTRWLGASRRRLPEMSPTSSTTEVVDVIEDCAPQTSKAQSLCSTLCRSCRHHRRLRNSNNQIRSAMLNSVQKF